MSEDKRYYVKHGRTLGHPMQRDKVYPPTPPVPPADPDPPPPAPPPDFLDHRAKIERRLARTVKPALEKHRKMDAGGLAALLGRLCYDELKTLRREFRKDPADAPRPAETDSADHGEPDPDQQAG